VRRRIQLDGILVDLALSIREEIDPALVEQYVACFDELPPPLVYEHNGVYLLADGFHRITAARRLGFETIVVELKRGTREAAIEAGIAANSRHGKRLSTTERRRAIISLWDIHPDWSGRQIATAVGVSGTWVNETVGGEKTRRMVLEAANASEREELRALLPPQWDVIARADDAWRKDLALSSARRGWTRDEIRDKAVALRDNGEFPPDVQVAIVQGRFHPAKKRKRQEALERAPEEQGERAYQLEQLLSDSALLATVAVNPSFRNRFADAASQVMSESAESARRKDRVRFPKSQTELHIHAITSLLRRATKEVSENLVELNHLNVSERDRERLLAVVDPAVRALDFLRSFADDGKAMDEGLQELLAQDREE
jgi:ParB-like chromosome segregation protein Spo0J